MQDKNERSTWGGKREGSGRKKRAKTVTTGFRVNEEALIKAKSIYNGKDNVYLNKKVNDFIIRLSKIKHHE